MGGITRTLTVNGTVMHELNFSCDPAATARVLGAACPVRIATAQNCLPNYFSRDEFATRTSARSWLSRRCAYWFDDMARAGYGDGFVCWDVVAAALIARPDLFIDKTMRVTINERLFAAGYLEEAAEDALSAEIHVPEIADPRAFREVCYATWSKACKKLGLA
jgi:purine nucleosidase